MVLPFIQAGRALQERLMTDTAEISLADGTIIAASVACRVHHERLFSETPDPIDANTRSMFEWVWTFPAGTNVEVGYYIRKPAWDRYTIVGEVMKDGTWEMATRAWATEPKDAVQITEIELWRYSEIADDLVSVGTFNVRIHYDRNLPEETPARYSPTTVASYKGGTVVGDLDFDVEVGDRFAIGDYPATISHILPFQPQRIEARFEMDVSGDRM